MTTLNLSAAFLDSCRKIEAMPNLIDKWAAYTIEGHQLQAVNDTDRSRLRIETRTLDKSQIHAEDSLRRQNAINENDKYSRLMLEIAGSLAREFSGLLPDARREVVATASPDALARFSGGIVPA